MDDSSTPRTGGSHERPVSPRQKLRAWGAALRPRWLKRYPIALPKEGFARALIFVLLLAVGGWLALLVYRGFGSYSQFLIDLATGK